MQSKPNYANCPHCKENTALECVVYGAVNVKASHTGAFGNRLPLKLSVCTKCGEVVHMWVDSPEKLLDD